MLRNVRYEGGVTMLDQLDLSAFASSVFGEEAPALEVDWALYLYHSLRGATGAPVRREKDTTLSAAEGAKKNLVVVGLADFYGADGKPLSRDGMIWFRLNQGSEPAAELQRIIVDNS
ncbi:MAG: hypothetical protein LBI02_04245, partial [Opitutaceae bacterium]|nr:hypothetical protein [Opitutaceae bacterium]